MSDDRRQDDVLYPDSQGWLHRTPQEAIRENQRQEDSFSRGSSGGCPQDPDQVPTPRSTDR